METWGSNKAFFVVLDGEMFDIGNTNVYRDAMQHFHKH